MSTTKMHVVVAANGQYAHPRRLLEIVDNADKIVAADGGANWLASQSRLPDVLIGDMDSVSPHLLEALEEGRCVMLRHSPFKDETDTELALRHALELGATQITILGALGGRVDHEMANLLLLTMPELEHVPTAINNGRSTISLLRREARIQGKVGDSVSLLPVGGDADGVTTQGLKYALVDESLKLGPARGVSNVMVAGEAKVTVRTGLLYLVYTPQEFI